MTDTQLPDTLSGLLRLAVHDAQACEADERYELVMSAWHAATNRGTCAVCMAGSVMARTLRVPSRNFVTPTDFSARTDARLRAINAMRSGWLDEAYDYLMDTVPPCHLEYPLRYLSYVIVARFNDSLGRADWNTYLAVADALERLGL